MPELPRAVAAHAALSGDRAAADRVLGTIALGRGPAAADFATGAAVDFSGTSGADKAAAGRVSVMALGAADLPGAVPGVALPGAAGEAAACVDDVTVAVTE